MEKNTTSSRHFRLLFQTPGHLCLLEEEENAEPQQGDEFPGDVRAPLLFFALSVGFEQTQQVCLTYTMQPSFIRMPPARHHKSPPQKNKKKRKEKYLLAASQHNTPIEWHPPWRSPPPLILIYLCAPWVIH